MKDRRSYAYDEYTMIVTIYCSVLILPVQTNVYAIYVLNSHHWDSRSHGRCRWKTEYKLR